MTHTIGISCGDCIEVCNDRGGAPVLHLGYCNIDFERRSDLQELANAILEYLDNNQLLDGVTPNGKRIVLENIYPKEVS